MSLDSYTPLGKTPGDGSTTTFAIPDKFYANADVRVFLIDDGVETQQTLGSDFTITVTATDPTPPARSSGNVVFSTAPASGVNVVILIWPVAEQDQIFEGRPVTPRQHERAHDLHAMRNAAAFEFLYRGWRAPLDEDAALRFITVGAEDTIPVFDADGNMIEGPTLGQVASVDAISDEIAALSAISTEIAALYAIRTDIPLVAAIDDDVSTVAGNISDVQNVAQNFIKWKPSVKAATTANITLSGTQTVDDIALVADDRCLVKDKTAPAENGIYLVAAGAWTRVVDFDSWDEIPGAMVVVEQGTISEGKVYRCSSQEGGTLDTTAITWTEFKSGGGLYKGDNGTVGDALVGAKDIFRVNAQTLNEDVTIDADENASCAGPLSVADGYSVTVSDGGSWAVI